MNRLTASIAAIALAVGPSVPDAVAQRGAFNGTQRHLSARAYSGVGRPSAGPVPTFSLPTYGGAYTTLRPGYGYGVGYGGFGYAPAYGYGPAYGYYQPGYVIYPPVVRYGW